MDLNETFQRMHSGKLYDTDLPELLEIQALAQELQYRYNQTRPSEGPLRQQLLGQMLAQLGEGCYVEPPLHANWGGKFVHFGKGVYANFNLTLVDDTHIYIGDHVMIGPNVTICAGTHPISPTLRRRAVQYNLPVTIGANVWLGAGSIVLPGVTIGENTVIAAGSVVTKDIPPNVVAAGTPCRVMRPITEADEAFYRGNHPIDLESR